MTVMLSDWAKKFLLQQSRVALHFAPDKVTEFSVQVERA
jgi:hypothetical protein